MRPVGERETRLTFQAARRCAATGLVALEVTDLNALPAAIKSADLPTPPKVALEIMQACARDDCSNADLGTLALPARVPRLNRLKPVGLEGRVSIPRPGVVFVPFFDADRLANLLTIDAVDDMSKEPEYKICACRIERA